MTISWEDDFHGYVHTYYVAKCYFGIQESLELPNGSVMNNKLEVPTPVFYKGNTKLTVLGKWIDHIITFKSRALLADC